jgi:D-beta-D-heptose 7-phosphate kinase/D-beta-D-heptose 1-phosphate adenosyltransferase
MEKIVLATGGFDPLHSGHIAYLKAAKSLGDKLIVGLNSDAWLDRKKGRAFMPFLERISIVEHLNMVDCVIDFDDSDNTAICAIKKVKDSFPHAQIIFVNGGDRTLYNIPEITETNVIFKFGVGGANKMNSSSQLLQDWLAHN